jgi:hypothetical protein
MTAQLHFTAIFHADPDGTGRWQAAGAEEAPVDASQNVFDNETDEWREPTDEEREIAVDAMGDLVNLLHPVIDLTDPQVRADLRDAIDRAGEDLQSAINSGYYDSPDEAGVIDQQSRWNALYALLA